MAKAAAAAAAAEEAADQKVALAALQSTDQKVPAKSADEPAGTAPKATNRKVDEGDEKNKDKKPAEAPSADGIDNFVKFAAYIEKLVKWAKDPKNKDLDLVAAEEAITAASKKAALATPGAIMDAACWLGNTMKNLAKQAIEKVKGDGPALPITSSSVAPLERLTDTEPPVTPVAVANAAAPAAVVPASGAAAPAAPAVTEADRPNLGPG